LMRYRRTASVAPHSVRRLETRYSLRISTDARRLAPFL
jgi:hypothetical protein